jgi:hypothetical protein
VPILTILGILFYAALVLIDGYAEKSIEKPLET